MKPINVELTHGHSIGMSGHYYRPQENEVLNDYMAHAADALTIDPNQRLQQENHELKTVQAEELENVKQGMENMKDWMKHCFKQIVEWTKDPLNPELARDISTTVFNLTNQKSSLNASVSSQVHPLFSLTQRSGHLLCFNICW